MAKKKPAAKNPATKTSAVDTSTLQSFAPLIPSAPWCLILGSMPSVASLHADQYYAHPRNGFWKILQAIYGGSIDTYDKRLAILEEQNIALWDSLQHCVRPGSLDSNIATDSVVCNDFSTLLSQHPSINTIAFNGKAAEKWFRKLALPTLSQADTLTLRSLPSSSPAMASLSIGDKTTVWRDTLQPHATNP